MWLNVGVPSLSVCEFGQINKPSKPPNRDNDGEDCEIIHAKYLVSSTC